jgi:1-acyl-sn-glycerol-3-phosphate acyltransferase
LAVKRGSARHFIALRDQMGSELERGHSLLVFPEGTRTVTGQLGDYQSGVFRIAVELQAPIIPVTVTGMYRVMRKGSLLIRPGYDVHVYCDAPIETKGMRRSDIPRLMAAVREVMQRRLDAYWAETNRDPKA